MRKFEKISKKQFENDFKGYDVKYDDIKLPERRTIKSAGYDFYLPYAFTIKPNQTIIIPTGIKVKMNDDEFLGIYVRGSIGFKYNIRMCNQVAIIDADYFENEVNDGHMYVRIENEGNKAISFKKGDRIVQGIFQKYLLTDNDNVNNCRKGGFGSTNKGDGINE